jgi:Spy/CpxP family protein refolding chaperone
MIMKKWLITCALLAAVLPLAAQEFELPPGKWWEDQRLAERVGLSAEQQQQIRDLVYEGARRMIDLKAAVDLAGLDLAEVVNSSDFDPQVVREAYAAFQTARKKLENERFEMLLDVRQVLTTEQWQKLQELKRRMQQMRQQRRPGERPQGGQQPQGGL